MGSGLFLFSSCLPFSLRKYAAICRRVRRRSHAGTLLASQGGQRHSTASVSEACTMSSSIASGTSGPSLFLTSRMTKSRPSSSFLLEMNASMASRTRRLVPLGGGAPSSACSAPASTSRADTGPDDGGASSSLIPGSDGGTDAGALSSGSVMSGAEDGAKRTDVQAWRTGTGARRVPGIVKLAPAVVRLAPASRSLAPAGAKLAGAGAWLVTAGAKLAGAGA